MKSTVLKFTKSLKTLEAGCIKIDWFHWFLFVVLFYYFILCISVNKICQLVIAKLALNAIFQLVRSLSYKHWKQRKVAQMKEDKPEIIYLFISNNYK